MCWASRGRALHLHILVEYWLNSIQLVFLLQRMNNMKYEKNGGVK